MPVWVGESYYYLETVVPNNGDRSQVITFKRLVSGQWSVRDVWIARDLVNSFCKIDVAEGKIKFIFNCSVDGQGPDRTWKLEELFP